MSAPSDRASAQEPLAHLSPKAAAHLAHISRRTIMRAIEEHELAALRRNPGNWRIARTDLERWTADRPTPTARPVHDQVDTPTPAHLEIAGLRALITSLEAELATARSETAVQAEATAAAQAETAAARQRIAELEGVAREAAAWRDALIARLPAPAPRRRWRFW